MSDLTNTTLDEPPAQELTTDMELKSHYEQEIGSPNNDALEPHSLNMRSHNSARGNSDGNHPIPGNGTINSSDT